MVYCYPVVGSARLGVVSTVELLALDALWSMMVALSVRLRCCHGQDLEGSF